MKLCNLYNLLQLKSEYLIIVKNQFWKNQLSIYRKFEKKKINHQDRSWGEALA